MIFIDNVTFRYPQMISAVIDHFSASFDRSEIVAITGRNGSGKTTLTRLLTGMLRPDSGLIAVDGSDMCGMDLCEIGSRIGIVFDNPSRQMFCSTVAEEVTFGLAEAGLPLEEIEKRSGEYLARLHIAHLRDQYPGKLSRGEKQCVMLAAMLCRGTDYIVLDEPTTGLDIRTRHELGRTLLSLCRERSAGIVVVSHERDFLRAYASREVIIG